MVLAREVGVDLPLLITLLYLASAVETECEMNFRSHHDRRMANQLGSQQVYSADDMPVNHVLEEGRYLASVSHKYRGADGDTGELSGYPGDGQYPTLCDQETTHSKGWKLGPGVPDFEVDETASVLTILYPLYLRPLILAYELMRLYVTLETLSIPV